MENEVDLKRSKHYPGPINNEDILSNEDIIMDPDKIKGYCNSLIKKGLEENKDFVIVSHIVFKYLHKIYGGKEVKRFIVNLNDDNNLTHVEIWLKKVNFLFKNKLFFNFRLISSNYYLLIILKLNLITFILAKKKQLNI